MTEHLDTSENDTGDWDEFADNDGDLTPFRAELAGPDPASVIGVSCFIIAPPYRRHGIAAMLLDGVIADAADRGAQWIEGYPHNAPEGADAGHFRGPRHLYETRGFEPVEQREHDTVMRRPAAMG